MDSEMPTEFEYGKTMLRIYMKMKAFPEHPTHVLHVKASPSAMVHLNNAG